MKYLLIFLTLVMACCTQAGPRSNFVTVNAKPQTLPAVGVSKKGDLVYNSVADKYYFFDGSSWGEVGSAAGANLFLSNLSSPTAINQDLIPDTDMSYNLGSDTKSFLDLDIESISIRDATALVGSLTHNIGNEIELIGQNALYLLTADKAGTTGGIGIGTGTPGSGFDSGSITIAPGNASGGGAQGVIRLLDSSVGTAGHVWTSTDTIGGGNWAAAAPTLTAGPGIEINANAIEQMGLHGGPFLSPVADNGLRVRDNAGTGFITPVYVTDFSFAGFDVDTVIFGNDKVGAEIIFATQAGAGTGLILMATGDSSSAAASGNISVASGANTSTGDSGTYTAGSGNASSGGNTGLTILQSGTVTTGTSGNVSVQTGAASGAGTSGDINLTVGATSGGTSGEFKFLKDDDAPAVGEVWTSSGTDGTGYYAPLPAGLTAGIGLVENANAFDVIAPAISDTTVVTEFVKASSQEAAAATNAAAVNSVATALTVSGWIKGPEATGVAQVVGQWGTTGANRKWHIGTNNTGGEEDNIRVLLHDAVVVKAYTTSLTVLDDTWHHFAFVYDGSEPTADQLKVYVDGVHDTGVTKTTDDAATTLNTTTTEPVSMGFLQTAAYIDAHIDDVVMLDIAATDAEIAEFYNGGKRFDLSTHSKQADLIAQWVMGEGDTHPTIQDQISTTDLTMTNMSAANFVTELPTRDFEVLAWGTTAGRPALPAKGQRFFDTDLNTPVFYNGTSWGFAGSSKVTADPCGDAVAYPESTQFYNDTSDYFCFCDGAGADVQMHSPATACF